ncbi:MAG TPA: hybrid sensor histidine kinase/response regulator [Elusimicrobiota bacterium]|nr:hybrid sensor histidine kinase/response regulator [Elusimicrobiota bacterium]
MANPASIPSPVTAHPSPQDPLQRVSPVLAGVADSFPARILVVDDEVTSRELCVDFLEEPNHTLDTAPNGQEALDLLKKSNYHLILSDINMPIIDGLQLLKTVKSQYPDTEVILITAYGGLQSALEALRNGAYDYITKPFTRDVLRAVVRRCLEKQKLSEQLKNTQNELIKKEKLAAVGSMAGWLAHRMRNPLNVILMCSQYLITKFTEKDERQEVARAIEDKVKILEKMTRDFIEFSRSYQPSLSMENLHKTLDKVILSCASRAKILGTTVQKVFDPGITSIPMDADLMEEVFSNIIDNATETIGEKADQQGTVKVIRVRTSLQSDRAHIEITNSGDPLKPDLWEKIFEPFFTTKEGGTGLGLAIARRVVESHGGRISVRSSDPEGWTSFLIELPLHKKEMKP